jgi:phage shock protein C
MRKFSLDRANRKLMGVCSGIARTADVDVTIVRIGVVASLFVLGPVSVATYVAAGLIAPDAAA